MKWVGATHGLLCSWGHLQPGSGSAPTALHAPQPGNKPFPSARVSWASRARTRACSAAARSDRGVPGAGAVAGAICLRSPAAQSSGWRAQLRTGLQLPLLSSQAKGLCALDSSFSPACPFRASAALGGLAVSGHPLPFAHVPDDGEAQGITSN